MAQTIEDVESRTVLQQFHALYKKQDTIETNVENVDAKVDREKDERKKADGGLQKLIYQEATDLGLEISTVKNDAHTNTAKIEYNTTQITALKNGKQDKLTAGSNITIDENNVISASGGSTMPDKIYRHIIAFIATYRMGVSDDDPIDKIDFILTIYNRSSTEFKDPKALQLYLKSILFGNFQLYPAIGTLSMLSVNKNYMVNVLGINEELACTFNVIKIDNGQISVTGISDQRYLSIPLETFNDYVSEV